MRSRLGSSFSAPRPLSRVTLVLALASAACGGSVITGGGGSGGAGGTGGTGGGGGGGPGDPCVGLACGSPCVQCFGGDAPCLTGFCDASGACGAAIDACGGACPEAMPSEGSPCEIEGLVCEYGDGPIVACRERAQCSGGSFTLLLPNCVDEHEQPADCPAAAPTEGAACEVDVDPYLCAYAPAFCGCSNCGLGGPCGGPGAWTCAAPQAGCPDVAPQLGTSCPIEGQVCDYGSCNLGLVYAGRTCESGAWTESTGPCPL